MSALDTQPRTFRVTKGDQPASVATFVLAVDGSVTPASDFEDTACLDYEPPYVIGRVGPSGGTDSVEFEGAVPAADVYGPAELYVDGERTDPEGFGDALPNTLEVTKEDAEDGDVSFEATVSGVLAPSPSVEAPNRQVDCGTIQESVGPERGTDVFHYSGSITDFSLEGPARVYRNGEEVDPADLGGTTERTFRVTKGDQPDGVATYVLAVDGPISPTDEFEDTVCPNYHTPYAFGRVGPSGGADSVTFTGDVVAADVYGPAELYVDGERTDPESFGDGLPHTLQVTKEGAEDGDVTFEAGVTDVLAPTPDVEGVTQQVGCGSVKEPVGPERGTDTVRFSGELRDFSMDGPATVYVDGEEATGVQVRRVTPVDGAVTVSPDTDVLLAAAVQNFEGTDVTVNWFVDGEQVLTGYPDLSVRPHLQLDNVSGDGHEVRVVATGADGETQLDDATWTVDVAEGANTVPQGHRVDPAESEAVADGDTIDLTVGASDPDGDLHRVLWFAGMCDDPVGASAVDGESAEATLTYEFGGCGVVVAWILDERGATSEAVSWEFVWE
ncbi:hypothetical protein BRC81_10640 [Halobacteriales archaeon QS_1_68_20]|nr:MAG: hypothetical protein BRC81_10640 [Halobacteriales archaeon QS_1_68_20]